MSETIPEKMNVALMHEPYDIEIVERDMPKVGPKDVLIKMMAVGVCGSDVHYYAHGRVGEFVVEKPIVLGHECAGMVAQVGDEVTDFKVGDRVAIEPGEPCRECEYCKSGQYNLCPHMEFMATPPYDGAFCEYISHPADFLYHLPDSVTYEQATLVEPFSVGLQACKRADIKPGSTVVIMGMGPVGLMAVVAAKAYGATNIIVSDLEDNRLEAAKRLGATTAINIKNEDVVERIKELTDGQGVNYAIETAGNPIALRSALNSLKDGGTLAIVGLPQEDMNKINVPFIANHEINIVGVFRYANTYPQGIQILSTTDVDIDSLFTHQFELNDTKEAMELTRTSKGDALKVMVYPNGFLDK